ncbi:hypothetical protein ACIA8G_17950 [Lentzea sp. NPDC051213]|uniref:hypothetical protein n=1 Tax=Lentzea sp. NPDC051213 TaxID=3364126 RepID=UPI003791AFD8
MKRIARIAAVTALAAGLTTAAAGAAHACSCAPATEEQLFQRADHVFQGRILAKVAEPGQQVRYRVVVYKERKGDVPRYVSVISAASEASCGIGLKVGKDYLIYAKGDAGDREVETGLCSGTRLVSEGIPAACRN